MATERDINATDEEFERELTARLGARADGLTRGEVPLAGLRAAGVRRARRRVVARGTAGVAMAVVLAVGAGGMAKFSRDCPCPGPAAKAAGPAASGSADPTGDPKAGAAGREPGTTVASCEPAAKPTRSDHFADYQWTVEHSLREFPTQSREATANPYTAADAVDRVGASTYEAQYLGYCWDAAARTLYVKRVPEASDRFDGTVRVATHAWPDVKVVFQDAKHSYTELKAVTDRVRADAAYWKAKGVEDWSWGVYDDGSGLEIGLKSDLWGRAPEIVAEFQQRYGPLVVGWVRV
ncbi:hypothetical protein ACPC54_11640 [Kitasatospora sp. NPDC094028]